MKNIRQETFLGKEAQDRIENAKVAIVGLGALGSVVVELLVRSGFKRFQIFDRDLVEESNIGSQSIYLKEDIGKSKVEVVEGYLKRFSDVDSYFENLDYENIDLIDADLILDCSDNLDTRFLINEFSKKNKIPFIYGAVVKNKGYVFNVKDVCLRCLLRDSEALESCETSGVLGTTASIIASLQVNEAVKIIIGKDYERDLIYVNDNRIEKIKVRRNENCLVCNEKYEYLEGKHKLEVVRYCSSGSYLIKKEFDFDEVKMRLGGKEFKNAIILDKITVFKSSVLIKAKDEKEALSLFSKYIGN